MSSPTPPEGNCLARAFRWRKLIETGVHATIAELAVAENVNAFYVSRLLRLTLLAPNLVEAILDGRQGSTRTLKEIYQWPADWGRQIIRLGSVSVDLPRLNDTSRANGGLGRGYLRK